MSLPNDEYLIDITKYMFLKNISSGSYGQICLIKDIESNNKYIAKIIIDQENKTNIYNEINVLIRVQHPTIIHIIGYSLIDIYKNEKITIVMDFMEKGSLYKLLNDESCGLCDLDYDNTKRQIILIGIAYGMAILHKNEVIHRDLKPSNVLLDNSYRPYIADFGLSKILDPENKSIQSQNCGTLKYMAPEVITSFKYGRKVDVYSFGILMHEVVNGNISYQDQNDTNYVFLDKVLKGLRPKFNLPIKKSLKNMIEKCWSKEPENRPSFIEIFWKLSLFDEEEDFTEFEELKELKNINYEPVIKDEDLNDDSDDDSSNADDIPYNKKYSIGKVNFNEILDYFHYISRENAIQKEEEISWLRSNEICSKIFSLNTNNIKVPNNLSKDDNLFMNSLFKKITTVMDNIQNGVISVFYFPINQHHLNLIFEKREISIYNGVYEIFSFYAFYSWIQINLLFMRRSQIDNFSNLLAIFNYIIKTSSNVLYKNISFSCVINIINSSIEKISDRIFNCIFDEILIFIENNDLPNSIIEKILQKLFISDSELSSQKTKFVTMINKILARNPEKINDDLISLIINKTKRNIVNLNLLCLELFSNSTEHIQISLFNDIFKSIFTNVLARVTLIHKLITEKIDDNEILLNQLILNQFKLDDISDQKKVYKFTNLNQIDIINDLNITTNIAVPDLKVFINKDIYPIVLIIERIVNLREEYGYCCIKEALNVFKKLISNGDIIKSTKNVFYEQCVIIFYLVSSIIKKYPTIKIQFSEYEDSLLLNEYIFDPKITYFKQNSSFDIINPVRHFIFLLLLKQNPKLLNMILTEKCVYPVLFRECVCRLISILNNYNYENDIIPLNHFNFFSVTETLIISLFKYRFNSNVHSLDISNKTIKTILMFFNTLMLNDDALDGLFWSSTFLKYFFILLIDPITRKNFIVFLTRYLSKYFLNQSIFFNMIKNQNDILLKISQNIHDLCKNSSKELSPCEAISLISDIIYSLNEAMELNDKLNQLYEQVSIIFYYSMIKLKILITQNANIMNEKSQKFIVGKIIRVISLRSEIKQAKIIYPFVEIFLKTIHIYDIVKFISDLCYCSFNNCIKCHEGELDLCIIDILNKWKEKIIKIVPKNNHCNDAIIESTNGLIISEKLIELFLFLFSQIASVISTASIVEKFIYLLHPINFQNYSLLHNHFLKFLNIITHNHFPFGAYPLTPSYTFENGMSFTFWISLKKVNDTTIDIIKIKDGKSHALKIQLINKRLYLRVQSQVKIEYNINISPKINTMITISSFYNQRDDQTKLIFYINNNKINSFNGFSLFTPISAIEYIINKKRQNFKNCQLFAGPLILTKYLKNKERKKMIEEGPLSASYSCIDKIIFTYQPVYRGKYFTFMPVHNCKEIEQVKDNIRPHENLYSFLDFIIYYHKAYLIMPIFSQINIPFIDGSQFQYDFDIIFDILYNLFKIGERFQNSFSKYNIFFAFSYQLQNMNKSNITFDLYIKFVNLLPIISCDDLQLQLFDAILMNFNIWSRSKLKHQIDIFSHWNDIIYPFFKYKINEIRTVEWFLLNISCNYYGFSNSKNEAFKECRKLLFNIANQSLNTDASKVKTSAILQVICSKESTLIEIKDMLSFVSNVLQKREAKIDLNILENQFIPFLIKLFYQYYKDNYLTNQILSLFISIYKLHDYGVQTSFNNLIQNLIMIYINHRFVIQEDYFMHLISLVNKDGIVEILPIIYVNTILGGPNYIMHLLANLNNNLNFCYSKQSAIFPILLLITFYDQKYYNEILQFVVEIFKKHINVLINSLNIIGYSCFNENIIDNIKHDILYKLVTDTSSQQNDVLYLISVIKDFLFFRKINSNSSFFTNLININAIFDQGNVNLDSNETLFNTTTENSEKNEITHIIKDLKEIILHHMNFQSQEKTFESKFGLRIDKNLKWIDLDLSKELFLLFKSCNITQYSEFMCILTRYILKCDDEFGNEAKTYLQSSFPEFNGYFNENIDINIFMKIENILLSHEYDLSFELNELARNFIDFFDSSIIIRKELNSNQEIVDFIDNNIKFRNHCKNISVNLWNFYKTRLFYQNEKKLCIDSSSYLFYPCKIKMIKEFPYIFNKDSIIKIDELFETLKCKLVTIRGEKSGSFIIGDTNVFIKIENKIKVIHLHDIDSIYYAYRDQKYSGFHIFMKDSKNYYLLFEGYLFRSLIVRFLLLTNMGINIIQKTNSPLFLSSLNIIKKWQNGTISNFEYLMNLNILSGRSFKLIDQYPIFPWIICDYTSSALDLNNHLIYRDLSKPIDYNNSISVESNQQMHSKYYSNPFSVYYFLSRLEPFSSKLVNGIGCEHSIFNSIFDAFKIATTSKDNCIELIPEFFFLPEFLKNHVNGDTSDVILPPWANNSAITFIYLHRKALESDYVSEHLSEWIDLIWGYKQDGSEAFNACNLFPIELYESIWNNPNIDTKIIKDMRHRYGQIPLKLFSEEHPHKNIFLKSFIAKSSIPIFNDRINHISFVNYMDSIHQSSSQEENDINNNVIYVNIILSNNALIISGDVTLDIKNNKFVFTLVDQEGLIYIYKINFTLFNYKIIIFPIQTVIKIKNNFLSKKKEREYKNSKITEVKFINSNYFCFVDQDFMLLVVNSKTGYIENIIDKDFEIVSFDTSSDGWLGISSKDSTVDVYNINYQLTPTTISTFKEPIKSIAFSQKFGIFICGTKDNCLLFCSFCLNKMKIKRMIEINEQPKSIIITDSFGFVVILATKYESEKLILYNINGEKIRSHKLENNKRITAMTKTTSVPGNFDFLIASNDENYIFVFEAFYLNLGKPIFKCKSKVIKLIYIKEESLIVAFCESGTVSFIYDPILS